MLAYIIVAVVSLAVGFGAGRVKNAQKLTKVRVVIDNFEAGLIADAKNAITKIKSHL